MVLLIKAFVLLITYSSAQILIDLQTETKQSHNQRKIVGELTGENFGNSDGRNIESSLGDAISETQAVGTVKGTSAEMRRKRVAKIIGKTLLVGLRAIKNLLNEADLISKGGPVSIYFKQGGYKAAYLDFHNLNLDKVQEYGSHKWGYMGNRRVSLEGETMYNPTRMVIQKPPKSGSDGGEVKVILYEKAPTPER